MCGIVGFNWEDKALVKKMASVISHRGPDDYGYYTNKGISLGHRRLSIIDLSKNGKQPIFNENGDMCVIFNGEIYNYQILRKDLEDRGHSFFSNTDTEVIIHGYEEYGEEIFSKLNGMFAIAIWDDVKRQLLVARDHIGEKPVYYHFNEGRLIFASEIKSILLHDIDREIDYLSLRYSPDGRTMFKGIKKLEPGSILICKGKKIEIKKYWKINNFSGKNAPKLEEVDKLIQNSVESRLMSDVPLGVFLSGGLDSSTIVAYMKMIREDVKTFSVGFNEINDETKYAKIVSDKFETDHKEINLNNDLKVLPKIVWHFDDPMADPAALPTYLLCREVSKKVKVALSGEGGDEVFGGYDSFNNIGNIQRLFKVPRILRYPIGKISQYSSNLTGYPKKQIMQLAGEILTENNEKEAYKKLFYLPFDKEKKKLIQFRAISNSPIDKYLKGELYNGTQEYYFNEWLPNDLLMKADKMSMAHSLEVRAPFLDLDLIQYFSNVDNKYKFKRQAFREVVRSRLPKEIMNRKKQGFTLPISSWFNDKDFVNRIRPHMNDLEKRKIFNENELRKIINNPKSFRNDHRMWVLLNFEIWNKIYMDDIKYEKVKI